VTNTQSKTFLESIALYLRPRLIVVLLLGFSSGLPLAMTLSLVSWWLGPLGISKSTISLFGLVTLPYTLKPLWAPFIDRLQPPLFFKKLGRRRGWLLFVQILLTASIVLMGQSNPKEHIEMMAIFAILLAFFSATQDIIIDAYRVESLNIDEYPAGAGVEVFGYRLGMMVTGSLGLWLSDKISWDYIYGILALFMGVGILTTLFCKEPKSIREVRAGGVMDWIKESYIGPFKDFIQKDGWYWILAFILLYFFGDQMIGRMSLVFYQELGFSGAEVALATKTFAIWMSILGGIIGASVSFRFGVMKAMLIAGVLHMMANFCFIGLAHTGYSMLMLYFTVAAENLSAGAMSSGSVAYLSRLCNKSFTGTQYALLSGIASIPRVLISPLISGELAERFDWVTFFLVATAGALPGIFILLLLMKKFPVDK
jgi:PAT family beta-lactamase induction signal transducer AmpG